MDFFGIGTGEILLVLVLALIIFGPTKLIEFSRALGKMVRVFRKATSDLSNEIAREVEKEKAPPRSQSDGDGRAKPESNSFSGQ